jgi:hypothetical protein
MKGWGCDALRMEAKLDPLIGAASAGRLGYSGRLLVPSAQLVPPAKRRSWPEDL